MTDAPTLTRPRVVIIGGGVSGAATAWHLAQSGRDAEICVVDPRPALGHGLAYSATDPMHRINVPAARMSIDADHASHFTEWLASPAGPLLDPDSVAPSGDVFPPRAVFGAYMADCLAPFLQAGTIRHVRSTAASVARHPVGGAYEIVLTDQPALQADIVVIATSHPLPDLPAELRPLAGSARIVANPYDARSIGSIGPTERVLIVGSGLTSADVIASLHRRGFRGLIHTISRHGYRSRGHGVVTQDCTEEFWRSAASGTTALLRHIRRAVAADAEREQSWHAVFDRLRIQGPEIWANLDRSARSRLVRHLRALWDVHRFRIAPQVQAAIDELTEHGQVTHQAARLVGAVETETGIAVTLCPRGSAATQTREFDRVVVTTGPAHGSILRTNAMLAAMERAGLVAPDPLGLGLLVIDDCRAVGADGAITANLFVAGPLARGHIGELMGLPEVTSHAQRVAAVIADGLARSSSCPHASPTSERVSDAFAARSDSA